MSTYLIDINVNFLCKHISFNGLLSRVRPRHLGWKATRLRTGKFFRSCCRRLLNASPMPLGNPLNNMIPPPGGKRKRMMIICIWSTLITLPSQVIPASLSYQSCLEKNATRLRCPTRLRTPPRNSLAGPESLTGELRSMLW